MMKKTKLSFSAISVDKKKTPARPDDSGHSSGERKAPFSRRPLGETERKRTAKSSTYQYTKKRYGQNRGSRPFGSKSQYRNSNIGKIPPPEKGIIRIIPLGGVEEVGKNMTAIEIGDDIIVIDAGMHFSTEATPGVDYVIPNTIYLDDEKAPGGISASAPDERKYRGKRFGYKLRKNKSQILRRHPHYPGLDGNNHGNRTWVDCDSRGLQA